jgi:putative heme-binding domain-containing protein
MRSGKVDTATLLPLIAESDTEIITQSIKTLSDVKTSGAPLVPLLAHPSQRVRFHAAIALGKLQEATAFKALLTLAAKESADPYMRHSIVTGLAGCATEAALAFHLKDSSALCCLLALARNHSPLVATFLTNPTLAAEAERAIHDDTGIPAALPALTTRQTPRGLNACLRLGIAEPIIKAALQCTPLQAEALDVLLTFTHPPRLDRIDGMAHESSPRDAKAFANLLQPHLDALLAIQDGALKAKAVELLTQLQLQVAAPVLQQIIADNTARSTLRAEALKLMASQHAATPEFATTLDLALAKTSPAELRREALKQLFTHQPDRAITEAAAALATSDTTTQQLALSLLATSKDDTVITHWLDLLAQNKAPAAIQLDILEAAATRENLKAKCATLQLNSTELLEGGDATRGKDIVTNHLGANCIACHTIEAKEGSQVGPNLKTIGSQKDRKYILESLLNPLAQIAPGFGIVAITTKNGKSLSAILEKEDAKQVTLRLPDGKTQTVPRDQIASITPPMTVMPPMLGILTKLQIRDVVAYLAALKGKTSPKK